MIKPENEEENPKNNGKFRIQKLPVYFMNILLWIPPQSALKNNTLLRIILGFHVVALVTWLGAHYLIFHAAIGSKMYKYIPTIHSVAFSVNTVMLFSHGCFFLFKTVNTKKQLQLIHTLDNVTSTWSKEYVMCLILLVLSAFGQMVVITMTEIYSWFKEQNYYMFGFVQDFNVIKGIFIVSVLSRVYQMSAFFLFTPYFAYLCFTIQTKLEQCFKSVSDMRKLEIDRFANLLCAIVEAVSDVNTLYETNIGLFIATSAMSIMTSLYMGIVFGKCYSYWTFALVGCFAMTLATFLLVTASVHTKVRMHRQWKCFLLICSFW